WFLVLLIYHRREEQQLVNRVIDQVRQSKFDVKETVTSMGLTIAQQLEARGEALGRREAKREDLEEFLMGRFGPLPDTARAALAAADLEVLTAWISRAATAATLEEVGLFTDA